MRKFFGPGSLPHPNPRVRALLGARAIDVALFFGGGPFLRLRQSDKNGAKVGLFPSGATANRPKQLRGGLYMQVGTHCGTCTSVGLWQSISSGRPGGMSPQGTIGGVGIVVAYAGEFLHPAAKIAKQAKYRRSPTLVGATFRESRWSQGSTQHPF